MGDTLENMDEKHNIEDFVFAGRVPNADTDAADAPSPSLPNGHASSPVSSENTGDVDITTRLLQFLATATPGTLGGIAVGLAAVTYFILGHIGLLLIGAFGGVLVFIQWERQNAEVSRVIRGETGLEIVAKLLDGRSADRVKELEPGDDETALIRSFDDFQPETRKALNELVEAIIRDYVKWWYGPIMPSDKFFPLSCRKILTSFLLSISNHLNKKRPADSFLDFLTNSSSIVIVFFSELSKVFAELPSESKLSAAEAVNNYLESHPDSNLSNLLNKRQQGGKFRMVAEDLLGFLDRSTYECDPARVFLREIMAGVVLEMTLQTCSKPEWINGWIVYLLESGEPDLSQAIDVGMQTGPNADAVFADLDGNVGNIGLTRGNRNSFEQEKARRKESMAHRKNKLSKAEEELEAMEEVRRLNQMIASEDARKSKDSLSMSDGHSLEPTQESATADTSSANEASERLADAFKRNANELDIQKEEPVEQVVALPSELKVTEVVVKGNGSDASSIKNDATLSPSTPLSNGESSGQSQTSSPQPQSSSGSRFTSFDQIVPPARDDVEADEEEARKPPPLTLHNAIITILDEPDNGRIKMKPTWDYLVQIEPATTAYPGWMIIRKYSDFERLHEILRRIAAISGATSFSENHNTLPSWKVHTRTSLRGELERYLRDACWNLSLADSEGMKRFLERDSVQNTSRTKSGFQAFEKLGKNMFDVLTSAPVEGSKAVVDGVTGVLGNMGIGQKKLVPAPATAPVAAPMAPQQPTGLQDVTAASRLSISTLPRLDSTTSLNGSRKTRDSMDSQRSSVVSAQPAKVSPMERRPSYDYRVDSTADNDSLRPSRDRVSTRSSREHSRASSLAPLRSPSALSMEGIKLPPPPDAISDDYESPVSPHGTTTATANNNYQSHTRSMTMPALSGQRNPNGPSSSSKLAKQHSPLSEQETRVAVELLFAVINELYTLSSAWNIRRTLLAAAKSFLLRPGNPSLTSIQDLIQSSVLDANTSDSGLATHLLKLRENTLPTEDELAAWPKEMSDEEKEKLRVKARKLLIESGVPTALMGVMGQSATSDALGRLFDCLQVESVARGLMFGIMLQAVRTVTH